MADKQQNITVNYKFNVADVERASATLSRANQASNQLQQAGQKAGQSISQGFGQARRSITSMETELTRLKTMVEVSSDPKRTAALSAEYKNLALQVRAAKKELLELPKEQKKVTEAAKSNTQAFGGLLAAAKTFFTLAAARQALTMALDMAELAGNVEGVSRAFNNRFANAPNLLKRLQDATQGTITDFQLMQRTLLATNLGVTVQALPKLLEFATRRARETGQSVDDLVDRIVRGIGVKSTKVLDDLGINALRLKKELGGVSIEAATVGQVTEAVGRIAQEELKKMGDDAENSATKVKQLNVAWENIRVTLSKKVTSGGLIDAITEGIKLLDEGVKLAAGGIDRIVEMHIEAINASASSKAALVVEGNAYKDLGDDIKGKIDFLKKEIIETQRVASVRKAEIGQTQEAISAAEKRLYVESAIGLQTGKSIRETQKATSALKDQADQQTRSYEILLATIPFLKEYIKELEGLTDKPQEPEPSGIISRLQNDIELLQEKIKLTNTLTDLTHTVTDAQGNQIQVTGSLIQELTLLQAKLADLQRDFSDIDIKPLKIQVKDAADGLIEFEANIKRMEVSLQDFQNNFSRIEPPADSVAKLDTFWTDMGEMWKRNWQDLTTASIDWQADIINATLDAEIRAMDAQISALRNHYRERQELAGDNERARSELRVREDREIRKLQKEQFEREKKIRRAQTVVDGAAGAIKAFANAPFYLALAQAAIIAATTVARLRLIDKEQPGFAKGVINLQGPGTGTSDSIPARLSKGESVMTAWETKYAGDVLKDVRAKRLDNKVLRDLKQGRERPVITPVHDDSKIIAAIEANKPPDVVEQSNIVYEVRQHSDTLRRKQRAKSMNI